MTCCSSTITYKQTEIYEAKQKKSHPDICITGWLFLLTQIGHWRKVTFYLCLNLYVIVPSSVACPTENVERRAAATAALRSATDVVVALFTAADVTVPDALTVMATITVPSLVGSS